MVFIISILSQPIVYYTNLAQPLINLGTTLDRHVNQCECLEWEQSMKIA